jgi:hypothetical protein
MPSLRTLFRTPRPAAETIAPAAAGETQQETSRVQVFRVEAADELYLRNPHGMLRMDPATAEAYVAAMSG